MKTFARRLGVAFLVALLFMAGSVTRSHANGSGTWGGPVGAPRTVGVVATADVLILGDSIVNGCSGPLVKAFAAKGLKLAVIAQSGQRTQGLADLLVAQPVLPRRVVMAAGSNDIFAPQAVGPQVARVKAHVAAKGSTLQGVDTYVARTRVSKSVQTHDLMNSILVNQQINRALPGAVIGAKAALVASAKRLGTTGYYLKDGLHYWPAAGAGHGDGCTFYAKTVAAGVK